MGRADLAPPPRARLALALLAVAVNLAAIAGLVRAFAPDAPIGLARRVATLLTMPTAPPPPPPIAPPVEPPRRARAPAGTAGRVAVPRAIVAPPPPIAITAPPAPPIAATGAADRAGAGSAGAGIGAGGEGDGLGGGGGAGAPLVKIAGDINSARDYPPDRDGRRIGDSVIVALTVGVDGHARGCRVARASRDPAADAVTCRLAVERFRFRPARDAAGEPVEHVFLWQQRWFRRGQGDEM